MDREEIKNKIFEYFKQQLPLMSDPSHRPHIQMGRIYDLFREPLQEQDVPQWKQTEIFSVVREIVQELINNGMLYPGSAGDANSGYPWLTITEHGKEAFAQEDWLPYDPEGYVKALKTRVPDIDDITLTYISESIAAYNRRQLLSATLTLGVASENLMLLLIEAYLNWIEDPRRKAEFGRKVGDRFIYTQYKEFKQEFINDVKNLPKELQGDWETYLDGVFNFIRLNRNSAGHPTGKKLEAKVVYANLQIFSEYANYIFRLVNHFK